MLCSVEGYGSNSPEPSWIMLFDIILRLGSGWSYCHSDPEGNPQGSSSGTSTSASSLTPDLQQSVQHCVYLKVLSQSNKKDFSTFTVRDIKHDEL